MGRFHYDHLDWHDVIFAIMNIMKSLRYLFFVPLLYMLTACTGPIVQKCAPGHLNLPDCPPVNAVNDESTNELYALRTWKPADELSIDAVSFGEQAEIPINNARTKVLGPSQNDALMSLAAKLWLIENAKHTVDVTYYIFKRDKVGYAILGALCNAVKRGVDVRMMVDSLGSFHPTHSELRALETCAEDAGFMRNAEGKVTTKKARVQVVIFNSLLKLEFNRRSHDKLLVVDGSFPSRAAVMTGGRNISLDYYGINDDGSKDPTAFRDLEILIRGVDQNGKAEAAGIGRVSEGYYTLLFLHKGNRRIWPVEDDDDSNISRDTYIEQRKQAQLSLKFLKDHPEIKKRFDAMPQYMSQGFHHSKIRLSHQLSNLTATNVSTNAKELVEKNPNSIMYLIAKMRSEAKKQGVVGKKLRIISPYLFIGKYLDEEGNVVYDSVVEIHKFLNKHPDTKLEIITNSVMTGDNIFTQAMIDIDMVPRLLLTPELYKAWQSDLEEGEFNPAVVESQEWQKLINHPQIFIYQTGKLDSVYIKQDGVHYGKLHAKFIIGDQVGFVGTSNFDYRSNLHNNEMGFFYHDQGLRDDLIKQFEILKAISYRWGSPEWLQMRKALIEGDSDKAGAVRKQRRTFKYIRTLGLEYLM